MQPPDPIVVRVSEEVAACVPEYLEITRGEMALAADALAAGDFRAVRTFGHNLKGSGASFGMDELTRIGAQLEACAADGQLDHVQQLLAEVGEYLSRVQAVPE